MPGTVGSEPSGRGQTKRGRNDASAAKPAAAAAPPPEPPPPVVAGGGGPPQAGAPQAVGAKGAAGVEDGSEKKRSRKSWVKKEEWRVLVECAVQFPFLSVKRGKRLELVGEWLEAVNKKLRPKEDDVKITDKVARKALLSALSSYVGDKTELFGCKEEDLNALCEAVAAKAKTKKEKGKLKQAQQDSVVKGPVVEESVAAMSKADLEALIDKRVEAILRKNKEAKKKLELKRNLQGSSSDDSSS